MTEYIILIIIMVFIYFVLIRNRPAARTDWETLPPLSKYKKMTKAINSDGVICCQHCGNTEIIEKPLISKKENANNTKFYSACKNCNVILWRDEKNNEI